MSQVSWEKLREWVTGSPVVNADNAKNGEMVTSTPENFEVNFDVPYTTGGIVEEEKKADNKPTGVKKFGVLELFIWRLICNMSLPFCWVVAKAIRKPYETVVINFCFSKFNTVERSVFSAISAQETQSWTHKDYKIRKNLFGMRMPDSRNTYAIGIYTGHATFRTLADSCCDWMLYWNQYVERSKTFTGTPYTIPVGLKILADVNTAFYWVAFMKRNGYFTGDYKVYLTNVATLSTKMKISNNILWAIGMLMIGTSITLGWLIKKLIKK